MARSVAERSDTLPALAEVFRGHGYEGASLAIISNATGLGKGSLYHFFPGGKAEMVSAVLAEIDRWFEDKIFAVLCETGEPAKAILEMFRTVETYFSSGGRVCLVGVLALGDARDRFCDQVRRYFQRWIEALAKALGHLGRGKAAAVADAEEVVAGIQGAIVLARALNDTETFKRRMKRLQTRLDLA